MNSKEFQDRLTRRAVRAGLSLSANLGAQLETYYRLLATWNQRINLTGLDLSDPSPEALDRLLVEPLVAAKVAPPGVRQILDIGSGGGSPAIPFTLGLSGAQLTMVESKTRKSVFLREASRTLQMDGTQVMVARFEELLSNSAMHERYDLLTIRAVRIEPRVLGGIQAFVRVGGELFLFRGPATDESERTIITPPLEWRSSYPLLESLRSRLVVLRKRRVGAPRPNR